MATRKNALKILQGKLFIYGYGMDTRPDTETGVTLVYATRYQCPPIFFGVLEVLQSMKSEELEKRLATLDQKAAEVSLEAFQKFVERTRMEYAYQMLLLLVMLWEADEQGTFSLDTTVHCFSRFYQARKDADLPIERSRGTGKKQAGVEVRSLRSTIKGKGGPYARFKERGFLDLKSGSEGSYFKISSPLREALTVETKATLRELALQRLVAHFQEGRDMIDSFVWYMLG